LNSNQFRLDVLGDNIANVNTNAFKGARSMFQTQFSRTLSGGSRPSTSSGGTNPSQIGLGSVLGSIQRDFSGGAIETTSSKSDLAIDGEGFFVVRTPEIDQVYTRDGTFALSAENYLVNADGFFVQGFAVDSAFTIVPGVLSDLQIPVGILSTARPTTEVTLNGTLDGSGTAATLGNIITSAALNSAPATPATSGTLLTAVELASAPGTKLFSAGNIIKFDGIEKGGRKLPTESYTVTATSTLGDLTAFLEDIMGINTDVSVPPNTPAVVGPPPVAAVPPGVVINATGQIEIRANVGPDNEINIGPSVVQVLDPVTPANNSNPFTAFAETQAADGSGVFTSFITYDSLGNKVRVDITMVKEVTATNSSTWRFYAESSDDSDLDRVLGTGTVVFNGNGDVTSTSTTQVSINRANTGAIDPMSINLLLDTLNGQAQTSVVVMTAQDGFPPGSLTDFFIGNDGTITGQFTNGLTRVLGQIAVSTFANPPGLVSNGNNLYLAGPNSGEAQISAPQQLGAGSILSGAIELSNIDLSRQFLDIITASTGFSASSRVITTADQLLDELLLLTR
jgi:flagellar hook protein FlgE